MENKYSIEELYPHLFTDNARSMVNSMLRVDEEAARIKAKVLNKNNHEEYLTLEEKRAIAFQCIESNKKNEKEQYKLDQARSNQKKILREFDPRIGIEERHMKVHVKRQSRLVKNTAEERLEQLRAERQKLVEEISPEELEKMKQEIKQNAEDIRKQDMIARKHLKEMIEKEKIAKQKEELMIENERKEKIFLEYKISQFSKIIANFTRNKIKNYCYETFKKLNVYAITLKSKALKINRKYRFKKLLKNFHTWKTNCFKIKLAEEAVIFEAEQEKAVYLNEIAKKNYEFWLKRRAFEGFEKYFSMIQNEKQQQMEALKRKEQFNNFINFVRKKTEEEVSKKQVNQALQELENVKEVINKRNEIEKQIKNHFLKPINEIKAHDSVNEIKANDSVHEISRLKQDAATEMINIEESKEDYSSSLPESEYAPSSSEKNTFEVSEPKKTPKISKELLKMQQRQDERRVKREALEAKYKEKREKEEQAKRESLLKIQEEEKRKKKEIIEKKKLEEKLKKDQEEKRKKELELFQEKYEVAKNHHNHCIVIKLYKKWVDYHCQ